MSRAVEGASGLYLIAPNAHPDEPRIGEIAIASARSAGVDQIVYHSVLHPQAREMPHHWQKLAVEELLFGCGTRFTIRLPIASGAPASIPRAPVRPASPPGSPDAPTAHARVCHLRDGPESRFT